LFLALEGSDQVAEQRFYLQVKWLRPLLVGQVLALVFIIGMEEKQQSCQQARYPNGEKQ
jgi:hypothetical protein